MPVEFTAEIERLVSEQLATGRFANVTDVLRSALLKLRDVSETERELYAALEDDEAGRLADLPDFVDAFRVTHSIPSQP